MSHHVPLSRGSAGGEASRGSAPPPVESDGTRQRTNARPNGFVPTVIVVLNTGVGSLLVIV